MIRVAVLGGGAIGLACAWRLARDGHQVTVLDAAPEAREASWAAGGMLAPHHEAEEPGPFWRLLVAGLAAWDAFAVDLAVDIDLRRDGGWLPIAADSAAAEARLAWLRREGVDAQRLEGAALRAAEPALAAPSALLLPGASVDPRRLLSALDGACRAAGVGFRRPCRVQALLDGALRLDDGSLLACDEVLLASGAWTPALAALAGIDLAGEAVKGQMLRLEADDGLLRRFVHGPGSYCIPRRGQGVVVGATMVCSGFDRSEDADAIAALTAGAQRLLPALAGRSPVETWIGLRPRLVGGWPCIGRLRPGLLLATGHFRNGILLTPLSAEIIAATLAGRSVIDCAKRCAPAGNCSLTPRTIP